MHGHLSVKADVFSFGVLVLELISGQRNSTFNLSLDAQNLLDWVRYSSKTFITYSFVRNHLVGPTQIGLVAFSLPYLAGKPQIPIYQFSQNLVLSLRTIRRKHDK